ncbi:hypothetical protein [Paenibacillus larvae]|nr:hypothetical protein [Paenibacillus larvae]MDT2193380.1 hypothetical protein [Paenibacillus larvae]MDT2236627.1 hypothetical protein [Paenibacillus larvae]
MVNLEKYFPLIATLLACIGSYLNYRTAKINHQAAKENLLRV